MRQAAPAALLAARWLAAVSPTSPKADPFARLGLVLRACVSAWRGVCGWEGRGVGKRCIRPAWTAGEKTVHTPPRCTSTCSTGVITGSAKRSPMSRRGLGPGSPRAGTPAGRDGAGAGPSPSNRLKCTSCGSLHGQVSKYLVARTKSRNGVGQSAFARSGVARSGVRLCPVVAARPGSAVRGACTRITRHADTARSQHALFTCTCSAAG